MTESLKKRWPLFILLLLLLLTFFNFCDYSIRLILYPYDWASGESAHLYLSERSSRGESIYKEVSAYPLLVINHPPVFFALSGALLELTALKLGGLRFLSGFSALLIGLIIYLSIRRDTNSPFWAAAGGLLFFVSPWAASNFLPMARVDSLMLALTLAGLYFCRRAEGSAFFSAITALFFLAAVYTKLTAVIPAAGGLLWLLTRNRRRAAGAGSERPFYPKHRRSGGRGSGLHRTGARPPLPFCHRDADGVDCYKKGAEAAPCPFALAAIAQTRLAASSPATYLLQF